MSKPLHRVLRAGRWSLGVLALVGGLCHAQPPSDQPPPVADPLNLLVAVENGGEPVTLLDGERFEVLTRMANRGALQGMPQFSPDGRNLFLGTREGWISKIDLASRTVVAEVRAGQALHSLTISSDGRWLLAAFDQPRTLVLLDPQLHLVKQLDAVTLDGKTASRIAAVHDAPQRRSFLVALHDIPELWEVSYDAQAAPIFDGLVHDYKMGEGLAKPGFHNARRTQLERPLSSIWVDPASALVVGVQSPHAPTDDAATVQVLHLDIRRKIAELRVAGQPQLERAAPFTQDGTPMLWLPNAIRAEADVINRRTWRIDRTAPLQQAPIPLLSNPTRQP